jgi:hypothetical protein
MNNINIRDLFDKSGIKQALWKKKESKFKEWFRQSLCLLKYMDESPNNFSKEYLKQFERLMVGYWGIGIQEGFRTGLKSVAACVKGTKTSPDHWAGVTMVGNRVHEEFKKCGYEIDYMVNEWLYENLCFWGTIQVSEWEHRPENIIRNQHSLEEKNELKHYINFSGLKEPAVK